MEKYEELFVKTKEFVMNLSKSTCLASFYIGKAEDVDERQLKHQGEGYFHSVEIAHSDDANVIDEAERYLIDRFKKEEMPVFFDNINDGGGGNPKADNLYVSLRLCIKTIDELEDTDEENFMFNSIEL